MRNKCKQGIVLITTMLTVVLVIMLLSSVVYSNFGNMRLTSNFYGREEAIMAAQSGVEYAVTKLQNNITWQGDDKDYQLASTAKGVKSSKIAVMFGECSLLPTDVVLSFA